VTDRTHPCKTVDEAIDSLLTAAALRQPGEDVTQASLGRYSTGKHMDPKIAGTYYWSITYTTRRTAGNTDEHLNHLESEEARTRHAMSCAMRAITDGRAHIAETEEAP
jgi:hypothetical protein